MADAEGTPRVIVIGAGLAGLVIARELRARGVSVRVLESSQRTGGKAGADETDHGDRLDHGYHVFPGWYANTRRLMGDLGILDRLRDLDRVHYVKKGEFPQAHTLWEMSSLRNLWANLRSGLVPWYVAILASFYGLELALQSFERRGYLDRVSANGFLRSRYYASEAVAETHQHFVLQASSIPNYELSAMTARRITQSWFRIPSPLLSILDTDLQAGLIEPLEADVRGRGAEIEFGRTVARLRTEGAAVSALELADGSEVPGDIFVLTTPPEATYAMIDEGFVTAERSPDVDSEQHSLSALTHLESEPMAALHVFFRRRLPDIPREHTVLFGSPSQLSFIDISQWWDRYADATVLSAIASDYTLLKKLSDEEAKRVLVAELREYLHPLFQDSDVDWDRTHMRSNIDVPLFLNTVGCWHFRPGTRTRLCNLFIAGDYCRSTADLTTMEGSIESALKTSRELLVSLDLPADVPIESLDQPLPWYFHLGRFLATPAIWLLSRLTR